MMPMPLHSGWYRAVARNGRLPCMKINFELLNNTHRVPALKIVKKQ